MHWHQVLAGRMAGWGMGALYGVRYSDMCAFRAITRDALRRLDMQEMTYGWNIEMQMKAARAGLRIEEIPMPYRCRVGGEFEGGRVAGRNAPGEPQDRFDIRSGRGAAQGLAAGPIDNGAAALNGNLRAGD